MPNHIINVPELPMLGIFDHLPVRDLLKMDNVSARFKRLQAHAFLSRHELTLLVGNNPMDRIFGSVFNIPLLEQVLNDDGHPLLKSPEHRIEWSSMIFERLDQNKATWLVDTFPNVTTLRVAHNRIPVAAIETLVYLLNSWQSTLVTFELFAWHNDISGHESQWIPENLTSMLLDAVNSLTSLKTLKLEVHHYLKQATVRRPPRNDNGQPGELPVYPFIELPVLGQLDQFEFYSNDDPSCLVRSLLRYGQPNDQLKHICLVNRTVPYFIPEFQAIDAKFATRFKLLNANWHEISWAEGYLDWLDPDHTTMAFFTAHFASLTALSIRVDLNIELPELFTSLSQLPNLLFLELFLNRFLVYEPVIETRLVSVKAVRLNMTIFSHMGLASLAPIFPSLQILDVIPKCFYCYLCGLREGQGQERIRSCIRTLLQPFTACLALRKIYFDNRWFPHWSPADLK